MLPTVRHLFILDEAEPGESYERQRVFVPTWNFIILFSIQIMIVPKAPFYGRLSMILDSK